MRVLAIAALLVVSLAGAAVGAATTTTYRIDHVTDGDTVVLMNGQKHGNKPGWQRSQTDRPAESHSPLSLLEVRRGSSSVAASCPVSGLNAFGAIHRRGARLPTRTGGAHPRLDLDG
jgi:hypothetical protein